MNGGIVQDDEGKPLRMGSALDKSIDQIDDGAAVHALLQQVQVVAVVAAKKPHDREAFEVVGGQPPGLAARLPLIAQTITSLTT